jgi:hypothetical protein
MTRYFRAACAAAILLAGGLLAWPRAPVRLVADPLGSSLDSDGDFLPDAVEWACLTNSQLADTDSDGVSDFVEVVQRANPRRIGEPLPPDHEMRIVVTSDGQPGSPGSTCLHLLFRFMGEPSLMTSFLTWIEIDSMPGVRISLEGLAAQSLSIESRVVSGEGLWVRVSLPLVSENLLRAFLPCTLRSEAQIGSRFLTTSAPLFEVAGTIATLVPYCDEGFALQTIGQQVTFPEASPNRVCVLQLRQIGIAPGGVAYEVVNADCDDCSDLDCNSDCSQTRGWILTLPGGVGSITGG